MMALFDKHEPHDLITVTGLLSDQNKLEDVGGAAYLASLTDIIPFTGTLVHHARIIRKKSILRRLIQTSAEVVARCYDAQDDIDTLVDEAEKTIFEIAHSKKGRRVPAHVLGGAQGLRPDQPAVRQAGAHHRRGHRLRRTRPDDRRPAAREMIILAAPPFHG